MSRPKLERMEITLRPETKAMLIERAGGSRRAGVYIERLLMHDVMHDATEELMETNRALQAKMDGMELRMSEIEEALQVHEGLNQIENQTMA